VSWDPSGAVAGIGKSVEASEPEVEAEAQIGEPGEEGEVSGEDYVVSSRVLRERQCSVVQVHVSVTGREARTHSTPPSSPTVPSHR
jgi:hypothetical protein